MMCYGGEEVLSLRRSAFRTAIALELRARRPLAMRKLILVPSLEWRTNAILPYCYWMINITLLKLFASFDSATAA
jgi:hypothetical protein